MPRKAEDEDRAARREDEAPPDDRERDAGESPSGAVPGPGGATLERLKRLLTH